MTSTSYSNGLLYGFIVMMLLQLGFMGRLIVKSEHTLREGKAYRFRCAPIDPNDAIRGKYIQLSFKDVSVAANYGDNWTQGQTAYVSYHAEDNGYVRLTGIYSSRWDNHRSFLKVSIQNFDKESQTVNVRFPFERYYLPEAQAPAVEKLYNETLRQADKEVYAVVRIWADKDPVLEAVEIEGRPIEAWVAETN